VNQFRGLVLDCADDFGMAMTRGTDRDARVAVEKNIAVDVFDPDAFAAFGNQLEVRARIGRIDEFRVGLDDFASKLIGKIESIALPQRGRWVRQGQKIWTIFRDGKAVDMVSPIEGTISDVNEAVAKNPSLALKDPYGEGWLVTVQAPDSKLNFRNLFGGALARMWTEDSVLRLRKHMPIGMAAALAQDGGVAVDDITSHLPEEDWATLTKEFFLS